MEYVCLVHWQSMQSMPVLMHEHTHTRPFNGPLSGTTRVSRYQKCETNVYFTEARDSEWQWHQLGHMQACTSLQTDNHASTTQLSFFTGQMPFLPPNQPKWPILCRTGRLNSNQLRPAEALKATNEIKILCPIARRWDAHRLLNGRCGISMVVHDAPAVQYQLHPSPDVDGCYDKSIV